MNASNVARGLYHDACQPMSMGCADCCDNRVCGGLRVSPGLFDCMDLCQCGDPSRCTYVCRRHPERFVSRVWEVRGFGLENILRSQRLPFPNLPLVIPVLFHGSLRQNRLKSPSVAVKLHQLINYPYEELNFTTKAEIAAHFKFDINARLVISGVDNDETIEPYWAVAHKSKIISQLWDISPDLITVPNFSMPLNVPRWDNLHNMKRIAICWNELVSRGLPASLHLNARTDRDWERWTDFIGERDEVTSITVEFATGLARKERARGYVDKLLGLASKVPRALHLVLCGGVKYWRELSASFSAISLLDTTSFMKTIARRRLDWKHGQSPKWRLVTMEKMELLDELLQRNINSVAEMRRCQINC